MADNSPSRWCIFCQRGGIKLDREHAWPGWLSDVVPRRAATTTRWFVPRVGTPRQRGRSRRPFEDRVRRVCPACNQGWLSDLETEVRPHLEPLLLTQLHTVTEDAQRVIAFWLVKTTMTLDFIESPQAILPDFRYELYAKRTPPVGTNVWIAAHKDATNVAAHSMVPLELRAAGLEYTGTPNAYSAALSVGYLVARVYVTGDDDFSVTFTGTLGQRFARIWPVEGPIIWPPSVPLSPAEMKVALDPSSNA